MKKCPQCSAVLSDGKQKCNACGLSIPDEFASTIQKQEQDHIPTKLHQIYTKTILNNLVNTDDPYNTNFSIGDQKIFGGNIL